MADESRGTCNEVTEKEVWEGAHQAIRSPPLPVRMWHTLVSRKNQEIGISHSES